MFVELTALQARVVASLIEKAATTPDNYPLTTNALVSACNQSTNRDPVVDYSARDVDTTMIELRQLELARAVSGVGHRSSKHKHVVGETLGLDGAEVAVLGVLTLRGPQTLNEIATRTERYLDGPQGDADAVDAAVDRLADRPEPLVRRLERRLGEREPRIEQRWQPADDEAPAPATAASTHTKAHHARRQTIEQATSPTAWQPSKQHSPARRRASIPSSKNSEWPTRTLQRRDRGRFFALLNQLLAGSGRRGRGAQRRRCPTAPRSLRNAAIGGLS